MFKIKETTQHLLITIIMTAVLGQVYLNPFNTNFRITLGVISLTFLLIYFEDLHITKTSFITGFFVVLFRIVLYLYEGGNLSLIFEIYLPSIFYYFTFGLLLNLFDIRSKMKYPIMVFFILSTSDIISNIIEILIRRELESLTLNQIIGNIFTSGFVRALISLILYWIFHTMKDLALREEKRKEKANLFVLSSKIIGERYYLLKSMQDIEATMEASHEIYLQIKDSPFEENNPGLSKKLINLSNNIHEIKKDYRRIVQGLEGIVPNLKTKNIMSVQEIFNIIMDTNKRFDKLIEKNIELTGKCNSNLQTDCYLALTTILNNLINNAIEASSLNGEINLDIYETNDNIIFSVSDNGSGINEKDLSLIFVSGFSTKYDKITGKMSTGVGLTHVESLVKDLFNGEINIISTLDKGSTFEIILPFTKFTHASESTE